MKMKYIKPMSSKRDNVIELMRTSISFIDDGFRMNKAKAIHENIKFRKNNQFGRLLNRFSLS